MKLLVTDMDGTFLNSDRKISEENVNAVHRLKMRGIETVICTGRPISFIGDYVRQSGVSSTVIGCNGAVIADIANEKILHYTGIAPETIRCILDFCMERKFDMCAYNEKGVVYFSENSKRVSVFYEYNERIAATKSNAQPVKILPLESNVEQFLREHICKFLVTASRENDLPETWDFLNGINAIYAVSSMQGVIDIMHADVSKGEGVKKLAEIMGISLMDICTVGDNKNDIPMFEISGTSICMANGDTEAKKFASHVTTKTNDTGGFVEAADFLLRKTQC